MAKPALHDLLCEVVGAPFLDGTDHCYFQPPSGEQMNYPCIVYHHTRDDSKFADNLRYQRSKIYSVTIIDEDPDSKIPDVLTDKFTYCSSDRNFSSEGLSHFVYTLYYDGPRIKEENNNG